MSLALGRNHSDEYRPGLRKIARRLQGQTGLLFTNASEQEVLRCVLDIFSASAWPDWRHLAFWFSLLLSPIRYDTIR